MDTLENTKLTASIHHIAKFLKWVISIYSSESPVYGRQKNNKKK